MESIRRRAFEATPVAPPQDDGAGATSGPHRVAGPDGSLRPYVTIWAVRVDDDIHSAPAPETTDGITAAYHAKDDR